MSRIQPLPPLRREYEMFEKPRGTPNLSENGEFNSPRRQSIMSSSNPRTDSLPIDCVLVYDRTRNIEPNYTPEQPRKKHYSTSERRRRFEEYLKQKQGLILKDVDNPSKRLGFVTVHTPFNTLLLTAENMRMRLPIEKIESHQDKSLAIAMERSRWSRWTKRVKQFFRLDPSLTLNDPDYYTAIYSANIPRFEELFETLRGSKDLYFTPTERSLLTHELLSRAHFDYEEEEEYNASKALAQTANTESTGPSRKTVKRHGIARLIAKKAYESYFPLHEPLRDDLTGINDQDLTDREKLKKHWATMRRCFKFQPLSLIRSYMGEKVAFYFALCGFYNQMLIPAALVGLIIFIYGIASVFSDQPTSDICGDYGKNTDMCPRCDKTCPFWKLSESCLYSKISYVFDNTATLIFAILMSLWARWFVELWKRRQSVLQYDWDSINFEEHLEPIRPDFEIKAKNKGEERVNPVTAIKEPYVSTRKRIPFFLIAAAVVILMMAIVCVTVFGTIAYRVRMDFILRKSSVKTYSSIIITVTSALINLICSIFLSQIYYRIARRLTDYELHKYQSKYDDSLTIKIYLFQFVNFYSSLFYIAFFKGRFLEYPSQYGESGSGDFTEQCDPAGCLVELSIQFVIIMIGKQLINNVLEFFYAMRRTAGRAFFKRGHQNDAKQWELDNELFDFNSTTLIDEYLELVIQFGFITLFVTAFPLAPLFALVNNIIELRLDAWKFLSKYKRPIPHKAADIGIWSDIISGISYFAVLTNAVVIAWTSEFIPKMAYRTLQPNQGALKGYVNWTLSSFPMSYYDLNNTALSNAPINATFCRYRDFRESTEPLFSQTAVYWNVTAARLAFILVFEHVIFFAIYLMQWLVPDVPQKIQNNIDHERYIDQRERWASKTTADCLKTAVISSEAISKMMKRSNGQYPGATTTNDLVSDKPRDREESTAIS